MSLRLYSLDVECPECNHRPLLRAFAVLRDWAASQGPKTRILNVKCAAFGCGTHYDITARAVRDGQEVRASSFLGQTVVDLMEKPDISPAGPHLSPRQVEIRDRVLRGEQDKRIAREIGIAKRTVREHLGELAGRLREYDDTLPMERPRNTVLAFYSRAA
jgi:ribosomal protein S27E